MLSLYETIFIITAALSCCGSIYCECCPEDCLQPIDSHLLLPRNCREVQLKGATDNGIYTIYPITWTRGVNVYCDLTTDGGGWTMFQRRQDGSVDFYRTWNEYRDGFGSPDGETWLGNDLIHALTEYSSHEMRIDMKDWDGIEAYALYSGFHVASEAENYRLSIGPFLGGPALDGMSSSNNLNFTTKDKDNDSYDGNCANLYPSGFWFSACFTVNPNGIYRPTSATDGYAKGVIWRPWKDYYYSLKFTEMKLRPAL